MTVRICIADDHVLLRSGLRMLLERQDDFEVVGEVSNGREALGQARALKPDVLILDISMPEMSGLQVTKALKSELPELKVVVLTMHESEEYLRSALESGADAYVIKRAADTDLCEAIRACMRGRTYVHPALSEHLVASFLGRPRSSTPSRLAVLTEREREVCQLIARGYTNREVAEELFISIRTAETHRAKVMSKLELSTRAELVRFASAHGLLDSEMRTT